MKLRITYRKQAADIEITVYEMKNPGLQDMQDGIFCFWRGVIFQDRLSDSRGRPERGHRRCHSGCSADMRRKPPAECPTSFSDC